MRNEKQLTQLAIESHNYHEFVPGDTSLHLPKILPDSLGIDTYSVPSTLNDGPTPCIKDYAIGCVYSGHAKGYCTLDGTIKLKREIHPGSAFIFEKYASVNWCWKPASSDISPIKFVNVFLPVEIINRICASTLDCDASTVEIPGNIAFDDPFIIQMLMALKTEADNTSATGKLLMDTIAQLLSIRLLNKYSVIKPSLPKISSSFSRGQAARIVEYINENLAQDISLESLSALTSYSSYHFAHMFKQTFGMAPHQYLVKCRIEKAQLLLKQTDMKIARIALEIGYESQSHFTSLFRRVVGTTPNSYRKMI